MYYICPYCWALAGGNHWWMQSWVTDGHCQAFLHFHSPHTGLICLLIPGGVCNTVHRPLFTPVWSTMCWFCVSYSLPHATCNVCQWKMNSLHCTGALSLSLAGKKMGINTHTMCKHTSRRSDGMYSLQKKEPNPSHATLSVRVFGTATLSFLAEEDPLSLWLSEDCAAMDLWN